MHAVQPGNRLKYEFFKQHFITVIMISKYLIPYTIFITGIRCVCPLTLWTGNNICFSWVPKMFSSKRQTKWLMVLVMGALISYLKIKLSTSLCQFFSILSDIKYTFNGCCKEYVKSKSDSRNDKMQTDLFKKCARRYPTRWKISRKRWQKVTSSYPQNWAEL